MRIASQSTPPWSQKRASSAATTARCIDGAMREMGTGCHSKRVDRPDCWRDARRLSMKAVVAGNRFSSGRTSGSVAKKVASAATIAAHTPSASLRNTGREGVLALDRLDRATQLPHPLVRFLA